MWIEGYDNVMLKRYTFLAREYAKRNETVIGVDSLTHLLAHSLAPSLDLSFRCELPVLDNSADQCVRLA